MKSTSRIAPPVAQKFASPADLAKAYDKASALVRAYENAYGEGNFHVVLGDRNCDRGFIAGDYRELANTESGRGWRIYPDLEGLAWMEAVLVLPEISLEGAMYPRDILFAASSYFDKVDDTTYAFDIICPRCGAYRQFEDLFDIYKDKAECHSKACEGRGELQVREFEIGGISAEYRAELSFDEG